MMQIAGSWRRWAGVGGVLLVALTTRAAAGDTRLIQPGPDGHLVYTADARGNQIPDYSYAGYGGGGVALPEAPVKVTLGPDAESKDDAPRIQAAIDQVGKLPP